MAEEKHISLFDELPDGKSVWLAGQYYATSEEAEIERRKIIARGYQNAAELPSVPVKYLKMTSVREDSLFQLANIILNKSEQLHKVRRQLDFFENESIWIANNKRVILKRSLRKGKKVQYQQVISKKSLAEIHAVLQKEIIKFFDLDLDVDTVRRCVLQNQNPIIGFRMVGGITKKSKKYRITIDFDYVPTAKDEEELLRQLQAQILTLKRIKPSFASKLKKYKKVDTIKFFDERFGIYKLYKDSQNQYGRGKVPDYIWEELYKKAREYYEKNNQPDKMSGIAPFDIAKISNEFENVYCLEKHGRIKKKRPKKRI